VVEGTLLSLIDPDNPHPQPADIPETITLIEDPVLPEAVMRAFANIVSTLNTRGRIQGVQTIDRMTGDNRFRTETVHPDEVADWMDGIEIARTEQNEGDYIISATKKKLEEQDSARPANPEEALDVLREVFGSGIKEVQDPVSSKQITKKLIPNEGDYDILNDTKARLEAGEDPATVTKSRAYIKFHLEEKLKTVPEHEILSGKRPPQERMNARIRNAIARDPHAVKNLLEPILLRSK
jgi:hypothetical protein